MADSIAALESRKHRLEQNGKNSEDQGVLRKINRQIRNLKKKEANEGLHR